MFLVFSGPAVAANKMGLQKVMGVISIERFGILCNARLQTSITKNKCTYLRSYFLIFDPKIKQLVP